MSSDTGPRQDPDPSAGAPAPATISSRQALLTLRIIGASMGLGVTLFALVGWVAHLGGDSPSAQGSGLLFGALLAVAVLSLGAAIVLWRARVRPLLKTAPEGDEWTVRFARIQTNVIIVWALIEAPALFAEVVYFLYRDVVSALLGLAIIWTGIGLTWPKRDWLGP